jgi:uncharacterized membrane protein YagU involved in acid resistance
MSQQHAQFEEESGGEPSSQMGYLDLHLTPSARDDLPPLSHDQTDLPGQKLQAGSLGAATSTSHYLDRVILTQSRVRAVLALLSLIFGFVLVIVVIAHQWTSFINLVFVVLFGILAICLNLIFAFGRNASPRKAPKPEE